jgi:hypothetical protein
MPRDDEKLALRNTDIIAWTYIAHKVSSRGGSLHLLSLRRERTEVRVNTHNVDGITHVFYNSQEGRGKGVTKRRPVDAGSDLPVLFPKPHTSGVPFSTGRASTWP